MANLGTLADFKSYRNITVTTNDTQITFALDAINAWVARYCGITISTQTITEFLHGLGTDTVMLRTSPISSVTTVQLVNADNTLTTIDADTYRCNLETGKLARINSSSSIVFEGDFGTNPRAIIADSPSFPRGFRNLKVVYVSGYTTGAAAPADLRLAMYQSIDEIMASVGLRESNEQQFKVSVSERIELMQNRFNQFRRFTM